MILFFCLLSEFWTYVEKSYTWTDDPTKFPTKYVQFPVSIFFFLRLVNNLLMDFVDNITSVCVCMQVFTASVHTNYVDCNRWVGDFILSKVSQSVLLE